MKEEHLLYVVKIMFDDSVNYLEQCCEKLADSPFHGDCFMSKDDAVCVADEWDRNWSHDGIEIVPVKATYEEII